jgi:hypothetical protein
MYYYKQYRYSTLSSYTVYLDQNMFMSWIKAADCACTETFSLVENGRGLYLNEVEVDFDMDQYRMEEDQALRQENQGLHTYAIPMRSYI